MVDRPIIDWQWMFVVGIFFGSLISALTSKSFRWQAVLDSWQEHFGPDKGQRWLTAFLGGALAMFDARLAGGCPSGHGLSGSLQLAVSGLVALVCFFVAGTIRGQPFLPQGGLGPCACSFTA